MVEDTAGSMAQTLSTRRRNERFGRLAEAVAAFLLIAKGYRILQRRFRVRMGEVDLIAVRGRRLVFVEVKARRTARDVDEALAWRQAERMAAAANAFLATRPRYTDHIVGHDAILVSLDRWPIHLRDAMQPA
jgi:putative endonuclease